MDPTPADIELRKRLKDYIPALKNATDEVEAARNRNAPPKQLALLVDSLEKQILNAADIAKSYRVDSLAVEANRSLVEYVTGKRNAEILDENPTLLRNLLINTQGENAGGRRRRTRKGRKGRKARLTRRRR